MDMQSSRIQGVEEQEGVQVREKDRNRDRNRDRDRDQRRDRDSHRHRHRHRERDADKGRNGDQEKGKDGHRSSRHHHPGPSSRHHKDSEGNRNRQRAKDRERDMTREKDDDKDRDRDGGRDSDRHHRHKRPRRHDSDAKGEGEGSSRRHRHNSPWATSPPGRDTTEAAVDDTEGQWIEKPTLRSESPIPETATAKKNTLKRDSWMVQSEQDTYDFTQHGTKKSEPTLLQSTKADYQPIIHRKELNTQLREGKNVEEYTTEGSPSYNFGDSGSNWRMMKLKRVYEVAEETGKSVEEIALERYGDLESFDEAREERQELDRRQMYGKDRPDAKDKPTGGLYAARMKQELQKERERRAREPSPPQGQRVADGPHTTTTKVLDQTTLNRMQAALLKARLRKDPKASEMEKEYNSAMAQFANRKEPEVVVLSAMDSRALAHGIGGRGEVKEITTGKRKGQLEDNDDMTLEDMLREEKRTRGRVRGGEGRMFADRITKDAKFDVGAITPSSEFSNIVIF